MNIHSDTELEKHTKALFELSALPDPTPDQEEAIEALALLIEKYESEKYPMPAIEKEARP